jgi:ABC-type uncharacterized transport system permease subunit
MTLTAAAVTCLLYVAAAAMLARRLLRGADAATLSRRLPLALVAGALLVHGYLLMATLVVDGGLRLGLFNASSLVAWAVALLLALAASRMPVENLGIAIFPVAALFALLGAAMPAGGPLISGSTRGLDLHILSSVLAYSLLTIAVFQAVLLAFQDRHLHNRQPGGIIRALPPLQTMESLLFQMIGVGFVLLSISLLTGLVFLEDIFAVTGRLGGVRGAAVGALAARLAWAHRHPLDLRRLRRADARLLRQQVRPRAGAATRLIDTPPPRP